jgi:hypothetical protein
MLDIDTGQLWFKQAIEDMLLDEDNLYDYHLVYAATTVDPPEYSRRCRMCSWPDDEHAPDCLITKIFETIQAY